MMRWDTGKRRCAATYSKYRIKPADYEIILQIQNIKRGLIYNELERASFLVSGSVFMALSTAFHSINSPDNSLLSHSFLLVLFLLYWSFELYTCL